MMKSVKHGIHHFEYKGVYNIEFSYGKFYVGETGWSLKGRIKEHGGNVKHERNKNPTISKHAKNTKHHANLENIKMLAKQNHYYRWRIREALKIKKDLDNINRDSILEINKKWWPLITTKNDKKQSPFVTFLYPLYSLLPYLWSFSYDPFPIFLLSYLPLI